MRLSNSQVRFVAFFLPFAPSGDMGTSGAFTKPHLLVRSLGGSDVFLAGADVQDSSPVTSTISVLEEGGSAWSGVSSEDLESARG